MALPQIVTVELDAAAFAPDKVTLAIHPPPGYDAAAVARYPVLYFNDGQDSEAVRMAATLARLYQQEAIAKVIVVAVNMLPDRMGTYGLSDRMAQRSVAGDSRFGPVGSRADAYSEWFANERVPYIDTHYRTRRMPAARSAREWRKEWSMPDRSVRVQDSGSRSVLRRKPTTATTMA